MTRQTKALFLTQFKADDDRGTFEGYLATFGNVDSYGDAITAGAFRDTVQNAEAKRRSTGSPYLMPILWQHDTGNPIGGFTAMAEDHFGLYVHGELDLDIELGQRAYSGLLKGYLRDLSIGYDVPDGGFTMKNGIRYLNRISLMEGSLVTFGASEPADVLAVKSRSGVSSADLRALVTKMAEARAALNAAIAKGTPVKPPSDWRVPWHERDELPTEKGISYEQWQQRKFWQ